MLSSFSSIELDFDVFNVATFQVKKQTFKYKAFCISWIMIFVATTFVKQQAVQY